VPTQIKPRYKRGWQSQDHYKRKTRPLRKKEDVNLIMPINKKAGERQKKRVFNVPYAQKAQRGIKLAKVWANVSDQEKKEKGERKSAHALPRAVKGGLGVSHSP